MALLLDTNLVLDWIMKRPPFHQNAAEIVELCTRGKLRGYIAAHSILNIFYITRKDYSNKERRDLSKLLCDRFEIIEIGHKQILLALDSPSFKDLEDSLQIECAREKNIDYIITRDIDGFKNSKVAVMLPSEFLTLWRANPF